jgi:hypothetical protein
VGLFLRESESCGTEQGRNAIMVLFTRPALPDDAIIAMLVFAGTTRSSPVSRHPDSRAVRTRWVGSKRFEHRMSCRSVPCRQGMRKAACYRHDTQHGSLE